MINASHSRLAAIRSCFGLCLASLALAPHIAEALETTAASAHICSGCPSYDSPAVSRRQASERSCIDHLHRAGHPETQGRFAKPSLGPHYSFGYVGGGAAFRGEPRFADEGTWGVDYSGILFKKKIWLQWFHGHREPRVEGSYEPDGPHLLGH